MVVTSAWRGKTLSINTRWTSGSASRQPSESTMRRKSRSAASRVVDSTTPLVAILVLRAHLGKAGTEGDSDIDHPEPGSPSPFDRSRDAAEIGAIVSESLDNANLGVHDQQRS